MKYSILIILLWWNPINDDGRGHNISHLDGKPLTFASRSACRNHVDENWSALKGYVEGYYKSKATISEVRCVGKVE